MCDKTFVLKSFSSER